jgi:outer membrane protein
MFSSFTRLGVIPALILIVFPCFCQAQQPRLLPLDEAIGLARGHSFQLKTDSLQLVLTQNQITQAKSAALPQFVMNSTYQRLSNNITPFVISLPEGSFAINPQVLNQSYNAVQLNQLLFAGGKARYGIKAVQKEAQARQAEFTKSILEQEYATTDLWFNLYNARASRKLILANIETLKGKRNDLDEFRKQGLVLENDVLKIDLSITILGSTLAEINSVVESLNYNLCMITGIDPATVIEIPDTFRHPVTEIQPLGNYMNAALTGRPEIKMFELRKEAAQYRIKVSKADFFPTLSLIGSYNYDRPNQRIIPNVNRFNYSAYAGLNLNWRISSLYTNQSRLRESKLSAYQLESTFQQVKEGMQMEVNANYQEYKKTLEKGRLVRTELTQSEENFRVEQNKLNAQTTTPADFLDSNLRLLQAQVNLVTATANTELAYRKLIKSTGVTNH